MLSRGVEQDCRIVHGEQTFSANGATIVGRHVTGYVNKGANGELTLHAWHGPQLMRRGVEDRDQRWMAIKFDWISAVPVLFFLSHGRVIAGAYLGDGGSLFRGELLADRYTEDNLKDAWCVACSEAESWVQEMIDEQESNESDEDN